MNRNQPPTLANLHYSVIDLINDLIAQNDDLVSKGENHNRDTEYKLKVILHILNTILQAPDGYNNPLKRVVEKDVEQNTMLFSFLYYLSSQRQFNYTWSYLRNQCEDYKLFLFNASKFVTNMLADINLIGTKLGNNNLLCLVFNDVFHISYQTNSPFVKAEIIFENLCNIGDAENGYYISAKFEKTTIMTSFRKFDKDINSFIDNTLNLLPIMMVGNY